MKYDRATVVKFLFIAISIGSAIYVSLQALNYLNLYPAINEIQQSMPYQVDNASLTSKDNYSAINVAVTVDNPTNYSGLGLAAVTITIYFYADANPNDTRFYNPITLTATDSLGTPLGPGSSQTVKLLVQLTSTQAAQLANFTNTYSGNITAAVYLRVDLSTFLEPVTGTLIYTRIQDVPLTL